MMDGEAIAIPYECEIEYEETEVQALIDEKVKSTFIADKDLLSVIIPAYNEGEHIRQNLEECIRVFNQMGVPYELVVVNDGSKDNTKVEIEAAAREYPEVVLVTYFPNRGKGNALKMGCAKARGNLVVFVDADLEIHPKQTLRFIKEMKRTGADVIIGSKRHKESKVDYPAKRKLLSWGYHLLIRTLFGLKLTDTQPGFKLFKKEVLDRELSKTLTKKYAFDLELLVNVSEDGYKIVEAPIELKFSSQFGGRIGFKAVKGIFQETMGIFYRLRIKRFYGNNAHPAYQVNPALEQVVLLPTGIRK
jgi:glycosyltransferase involved in cell wall biosynthesis